MSTRGTWETERWTRAVGELPIQPTEGTEPAAPRLPFRSARQMIQD